MVNPPDAARRALPSVDRLLQQPRVAALIEQHGRPLVVEAIRAVIDAQRAAMARSADVADEATLIERGAEHLAAAMRPSMRAVFNLTGTVLHTNLGRALVAKIAADAAYQAMTRAVNLEFDVDGGARGERDSHVEDWLRRLTGAEAAVKVLSVPVSRSWSFPPL